MLKVSKVRKDRRARSEICPECEVERDSERRGEPVVWSARTAVWFPTRVV